MCVITTILVLFMKKCLSEVFEPKLKMGDSSDYVM